MTGCARGMLCENRPSEVGVKLNIRCILRGSIMLLPRIETGGRQKASESHRQPRPVKKACGTLY